MRQNMFNITLVELIVVIAILAILAGTAAGIGVTLINKNTNKTAQSEVNMLVDDFKTFVTVAVSEEDAELGASEGKWLDGAALLTDFRNELQNDSKQKDKIGASTAWTQGPAPAADADKGDVPKAGQHVYNVYYTFTEATATADAQFEVTFVCAVKGALKFNNSNFISCTYKYSKTIG